MSSAGGRMSLLVRNLRYETSPERVRKYFEQFGEVRDVYLPLHYHTKKPRGFGFVEFFDDRDAHECLRHLHRTNLDGNEISVTIAQQGRKSPETMRYREEKYTGDEKEGRSGRSSYRSRSRSYSPVPHRGAKDDQRGHRNSWRRSRSRSRSFGRNRHGEERDYRRGRRGSFGGGGSGDGDGSRNYDHGGSRDAEYKGRYAEGRGHRGESSSPHNSRRTSNDGMNRDSFSGSHPRGGSPDYPNPTESTKHRSEPETDGVEPCGPLHNNSVNDSYTRLTHSPSRSNSRSRSRSRSGGDRRTSYSPPTRRSYKGGGNGSRNASPSPANNTSRSHSRSASRPIGNRDPEARISPSRSPRARSDSESPVRDT